MINPEYDYNLDKTLIGHTDYVISLLQLSNGMLVSGSGDGTIIIWNPNKDSVPLFIPLKPRIDNYIDAQCTT